MIRSFISKLWVKVRLAVIIILSITIGATWFYLIQQYQIIRAEADQVWEEHLKREQRIENKSVGEPVEENLESESKAESHAQPEGEEAVNTTSSLPSGEIEKIIYAYFKDDYEIAKAIFTAESRLNPRAKG